MKPLRLALLLCGVSACIVVPRLVPATPTGADAELAFTEVAGVRLWAGGRWDGVPVRLPEMVTPIKLVIENHSGHPVRVSYRDCTLVGTSGFRYAALPPFPLRQAVGRVGDPGTIVLADYHPAQPVHPARPVKPRYPHRHFHVAPPYVHVLPGLVVWSHLWAWDMMYASMWARWPVELPTVDMQEQALPEGVLDDGGVITGFLYFQRATNETALRLEVQLVDAETEAPLGTAALPFVVRY